MVPQCHTSLQRRLVRVFSRVPGGTCTNYDCGLILGEADEDLAPRVGPPNPPRAEGRLRVAVELARFPQRKELSVTLSFCFRSPYRQIEPRHLRYALSPLLCLQYLAESRQITATTIFTLLWCVSSPLICLKARNVSSDFFAL